MLLTEEGMPDTDAYDAVWRVKPPFGPFPRALAESYPLTATVPDRTDRAAECAAAEGVRTLVAANPETEFTLTVAAWHPDAEKRIPDRVSVESLSAIHQSGSAED